MLDMGFLPSLRIILKAVPASRQTLLFSATIEKSVAHLVAAHVRNPVRVAIGPATKPVEQVTLHVYEVESDRKLSLLTDLIGREPGTFLVFARTKHGTDRLAKKLARTGVKAARIHGGRTQNQRNQALNGFKDGAYRILVATDVAARGIHVEGIAHVVNYDLPQVPEDFIHRVGRTGRAGARGTASTFSTRSERGEIRNIERTLNVRLTPREVAADLPRESKPAPEVIRDAARNPLRPSQSEGEIGNAERGEPSLCPEGSSPPERDSHSHTPQLRLRPVRSGRSVRQPHHQPHGALPQPSDAGAVLLLVSPLSSSWGLMLIQVNF